MGKRIIIFSFIALITLSCYAPVWGQKAFTRDAKLNAAIQSVYNGDSNESVIKTLEAAFKNDPQNADLAGMLAGAYGIMADKTGRKGLDQKANEMADKAIKLNPNSIPAKMANLGSGVYNRNKAKRDKAINELERLSAANPETARVAKYLIGKGHVLNGNRSKAIENFKASGIPLARDNSANIDKMIKPRRR